MRRGSRARHEVKNSVATRTKVLIPAREAALAIIERDPGLREHPDLHIELELRTGDAQLWTGESG